MFHIMTILLFGALAATGLYHRIRAARAGGGVSRREEGVPMMVLLRLFGFAMWIGLIVYMIHPAWMAWASLALPDGLRWVGAGLVAVALPFIHWMFRSLGTNVTDTVVTRSAHRLVTEGPYRYVRHPMYSLSMLAFVGFSLLTANGFIAVTGLVALVLLRLRTPAEEARLEEAFGDAYRAYAQHTGRFVPKL